MMSGRRICALALTIVMVLGALVVSSTTVSARTTSEPRQAPIGPWIDEIVWSEQLDRSLGLTEIIAGDRDTIIFDITALADKQRALASDQVYTHDAAGLFDQLQWNPCEQDPTFPRNPFAIRAVREGMQYMIDRDFIVRDIWGGFAVPFRTMFHPRSPDYSRYIVDFARFENAYAFDPNQGRAQIDQALLAAGWTKPAGGQWHDPEGRLVTITGLVRTQDERLQMGRYYGTVLEGLGFDVFLNEGPATGGIAYGGPCDQNIWHFYTAGWIQTAFTAWDDSQLWFYAGAGCELFGPFCGPGFYRAPPELEDIADKLVFGGYSSLDERRELIVRGTELAMRESLAFFIEARRSLYVFNNRMTDTIFDLFGGNANDFAFKAAKVPDDTDGVARARILNLVMFVDGWNPWQAAPGWLYDSVQRNMILDPGVTRHPHTGKVIPMRQSFTVETNGPDPSRALDVPATAMLFNTTTNVWEPVGLGVTALSKVTFDMTWGQWHHGVDVNMADLLVGISIMERQVDGDISRVPGLANAADDFERQVHDQTLTSGNLKGIEVIDSDTFVQYFNYWHPDEAEIAGYASHWPAVSWEAASVAVQTLLDQETANNEEDAESTARPWLDLTKGDSLAFLEGDLGTLSTANFIPTGFATLVGPGQITVADATARWSALNTWYTDQGHVWPGHGPFYLDVVDLPNRQTIMKAFRTGYPWEADQWSFLTTFKEPIVSFGQVPPFVNAGTPATFDFTVQSVGQPTDNFTSQWFVRDVTSGEFELGGTPVRTGAGAYRVALTGGETGLLSAGSFEVITVVSAFEYGIPTITRTPFLVTPLATWIDALLDAQADLLQGQLDDVSAELTDARTQLDSLAASNAGLVGLVSALVILTVVAVVVAVVSVVLVLRRGRGPPSLPAEGGEGAL